MTSNGIGPPPNPNAHPIARITAASGGRSDGATVIAHSGVHATAHGPADAAAYRTDNSSRRCGGSHSTVLHASIALTVMLRSDWSTPTIVAIRSPLPGKAVPICTAAERTRKGMHAVLLLAAVLILSATVQLPDTWAWISVAAAQLAVTADGGRTLAWLLPVCAAGATLIYCIAASEREWVGIGVALAAGACFP